MGDSLRPTDTRRAPLRWQENVRGEKMRGKTYSQICYGRGLPDSLRVSLRRASLGWPMRVETLFRLGAYKPRRYRDLSTMPVEILTLLIRHREVLDG